MPATMKEADKQFGKPELHFPVKCDVHPWMGAYVAVMDHPYFDVTEKDGTFSIKNLPAGTYRQKLSFICASSYLLSVGVRNSFRTKEQTN